MRRYVGRKLYYDGCNDADSYSMCASWDRRAFAYIGHTGRYYGRGTSIYPHYYYGDSIISLYNYSANTLRAVGESRIPLLCLAVAVILNIFLDILFVHTFSMGLRGAAHATNIAQCIAGVLCMAYLLLDSGNLYQRGRNGRCRGESIRR